MRDADELAEVHLAAWRAAYRGLMDAAALDALDPAARADFFRQGLPSDVQREHQRTWIVAEQEGEILGHAMSHVVEGEAVLEYLYLRPDAVGTGIGHTLHEMMMRALHRNGAQQASLIVLEGNPAIGFYERHGWELTGARADDEWSGIPVTHLQMRRELGVQVLAANRTYWDEQAPVYADRQHWDDEVSWGIFQSADRDRNGNSLFPDVQQRDVVELGCGTGYVSYWALGRGARSVVGIDYSPKQLASSQVRAKQKGVVLPVVQGDAHRLPFGDDSFDVAINEYGAAIWCDPHVWIPEAARVLRPGGVLWFLGNSVAAMLCMPEFDGEEADERLRRPQRDMHRFEWLDSVNVEFHVSHGEMIAILTGAGFTVEALHEIYAEPGAANEYGFFTADWAGQWPVEEVWVARLAG